MDKYFRYLWYLIKHKWFVFKACIRYSSPYRAGIIAGIYHDMSKFSRSEFGPYMRHFYGKDGVAHRQAVIGVQYEGNDEDYDFWYARYIHIRRNPHHWQHWLTIGNYPVKMPVRCVNEMLCDWEGAGKAKGETLSVKEWYLKNCDKIHVHKDTHNYIKKVLNIDS